jgi:hypothetical protein
MPSEPRMFTRADDELIIRNSRGEFNMKDLRKRLRANLTTIQRRADELGVRLILRSYRPPGREAGSFPSTHDNLTPARISDDKLLKRLHRFHGEGDE